MSNETMPERALSLTWPWPHFMLVLPEPLRKKIENRKPGFSHKSFRGECWVHCTKPPSRQYFYDACAFAMDHGVPRLALPSFDTPGIGCIVGRWDVVKILPPPEPADLPDRWRMAGQWGFVVERAQAVTPVFCKGALGFWRVAPGVLAQLARAA